VSGAEESDKIEVVREGTTVKLKGDSTVYYSQIVGHLRFDVQSLSCAHHYSGQRPVAEARFLKGKAAIAERSGLGIVGTEDFQTSTVSISIRRLEDEARLKILSGDDGDSFQKAAGLAFICFFEADWEFDRANEWTVQFDLRHEVFDQLYESTSARRLRALEINALLGEHIYTDSRFGPHNMPRTWRLCPRDGNMTRPDPAYAVVDWLSASERSLKLLFEPQASRLAPEKEEREISARHDEGDLADRARESEKNYKEQVLSLLRRVSRSLIWVAVAIFVAAVFIRMR
jgi:hypothetical protein